MSSLAVRRELLNRAAASVRYWSTRATTAHGRAMLGEAKARLILRRRQVAALQPDGMSTAGVALVAGFEGFRSRPYRDSVGVWTIGYGETQGVTERSSRVTAAVALAQLQRRLNRDYVSHVLRVSRAANVDLSQREVDALGSLVYNLGPGILEASSTMGAALRSGQRARIAAAFLRYDHAGGQRLPGLTRRRQAERALFLRG